jgi:short-subunit dehydrogenase
MDQLRKTCFLITGATSGIGYAIARSLLGLGAHGVITGRNQVVLEALGKEFGHIEGFHQIKNDLAEEEDLHTLTDFVRSNISGLNTVIHCAGTFDHLPIADTMENVLDRHYHVNFRAPFILTRKLIPLLKVNGGHIIFLNSTAADHPKAGTAVYAAMKSALKSFAETLYQEVYQYGIKVISFYPGRVATPMQEKVCAQEGSVYRPEAFLAPESVANEVVHLLTLPPEVEIRHVTIRPPLR